MKKINNYRSYLATLIFAFFFLNIAMPVVVSMVQPANSKLVSLAFADDDDDDDDDDEVEEEASVDPAALKELGSNDLIIKALGNEALIGEGYIQMPENLANKANPNLKIANLDQWDVPMGTFGLFGLSNRDITWMVAGLHILFASFILAGPLFCIVSEATGAEKTGAVKISCAILTTLAGVFGGGVIGMIGEVILEAHGTMIAAVYAGAAAALVCAAMIIMGSINKSNATKMGLIVGGVIGAIVGGIFGHGGAGAVMGLVAGFLGGIASTGIMLAEENKNLERLAHELMKVVAVCYSFTALTGGFFAMVLIGYYPSFITWLVRGFNDLFTVWYPIVFIVETIFMYLYYYMWDPMNNTGKKHIHIVLGILLNISGISLLIMTDAPAAFMLTPTKVAGSLVGIGAIGEWAWINNFTWWPQNFHRLVGNLTYAGFIVGYIGALMFLWSTKQEDREFYDWQGLTGNALGLAFMLPLPIMGYIYAKEVYMYDAAIGMYIMSDRLSMFMEMQAVLIGFLFVGANFYMWISIKRVTGHEKYLKPMMVGFVLIFICSAIWYCPRHFFATMGLEPGMIPDGMTKESFIAAVELPGPLSIFALMQAKNTAAAVLIVVSLLNYILYQIACAKGEVALGKINPLSQYVLVFLAFADLWLMTLMGAIRELARKDFHVYKVFKDLTVDAYTPTLKHAAVLTTVVVWMFFAMVTAIVWMQLKYVKTHSKGH